MAKAKSNKSQVIRDYLEANPKAKPSEVVDALGAKGTKVSYNLVYTLKSKGKAKKRKQKRAAAVSAGRFVGTHAAVEIGHCFRVRARFLLQAAAFADVPNVAGGVMTARPLAEVVRGVC